MSTPRRRLNCWEYRNCGREHGGLMVGLLGECPVSSTMKHDGQNGGIAAGRTCWLVPGTSCTPINAVTSGARKCHECEFYRRVINEEQEKAHGVYSSVAI